LQKAKAIENRGRKLVPHTNGIGKVIRTRLKLSKIF